MAIIPPPGAESGQLAEPAALLDEAPGGADGPLAAARPRGMLRRGWEVFAENKLALASIAMIVFIVAVLLRRAADLPHQPGEHRPEQHLVPAQQRAPARLRQPRL